MTPRYCEVALPVPLRSTFTYAVPDPFHDEDLIGRRVLVPFRNRAMVGVALSVSDHAPTIAQIKQISGLLDPGPGAPAQAYRVRPLDQPLLPRAHRRNISRDAPSGNRAAP